MQHEFTLLPIGKHLAGDGIDDFRIEVVFPDVQAVLCLDALAGPGSLVAGAPG